MLIPRRQVVIGIGSECGDESSVHPFDKTINGRITRGGAGLADLQKGT